MRLASLITALTLSIASYGYWITIPDGVTSTTPIAVSGVGNNALIEEGGVLAIPAIGVVSGITLNAANQTAVNRGLLSTVDFASRGLFNMSNVNSTLLNFGTILTTGQSGIGMFNTNGNNGFIMNSGQIRTTGNSGWGMTNINGDDTVMLNAGTITTTGSDGVGMVNLIADDLSIINRGYISTTGPDSYGILSNTAIDVVITNSGLVSTTGSGSHGIFYMLGADVQIINSGTIRSTQSNVLNLLGATPTLTLLRGSNLEGTIQLILDPLDLNVERGLNLALTQTVGSMGYNNLNIDAPFAVVGNTVNVIDPTGLTLQPDVIADLSDTILNNIYHRRLACSTPCNRGFWVEGIGSYRKRSCAHNHIGYDNWHGGALVGYNMPLCQGTAGIFVGTTYGEAEVDQHTQKAFINSYIGGLTYETCFCNTYIGLAFAGGYIDWDNDRFVMNNLANGGVEIARSNIDGLFLSPEITLARQFSLCIQPVMSFSLRYAGFFPGSYHEDNFSVKDRQIDLLTTRLEAALPYSNTCGTCCWSIEPYIGVFGRFQLGGNHIDSTLLDQPIDFDQPGPRNVAAFLSGVRGTQNFGRLNLFLNLEASFDSASSARLLGEGGVGLSF